jgi:hypothetical protein
MTTERSSATTRSPYINRTPFARNRSGGVPVAGHAAAARFEAITSMNNTFVASSANRQVARSRIIAGSTDGWASKSKSSSRQGAGKFANRNRPAWRRCSVASTSIDSSRSRNSVWVAFDFIAASSSPGSASAAAVSLR